MGHCEESLVSYDGESRLRRSFDSGMFGVEGSRSCVKVGRMFMN